jgi:hypothetical protein
MEGAIYLGNYFSPEDIGKDELGLLSNTGVQSLKYILPNASVLTLEKRRPLTVGERRKLGRTVNTAIESPNSQDPASRLKMIAEEMGDGLAYSETFPAVKNPNQIVTDKNGTRRPKWAIESFKKRTKPQKDETSTERVNDIGDETNIDTVDGAVQHIENGGSLADIDPEVLQKALAKSSKIKKKKINNRETIIEVSPNQQFIRRSNNKKFEYLGNEFASQVQEFLGLIAPEVIPLGAGDSRDYLVRDPGSLFRDSEFKRTIKLSDIQPAEMAKLLVADIVTDTRSRNIGNLASLSSQAGPRLISTLNVDAGLQDLDEIQIRARTNMAIGELYSPSPTEIFRQYFLQLQRAQQNQYRQFIATLLRRARAFNFSQFRSRLYSDGKLSPGEKIHLNILEKLFNQRVTLLSRAETALGEILT